MARWRDSIANGQPFDMVFPLRGKDGIFRPFLTWVLPLRGEEGRILQWFGTKSLFRKGCGGTFPTCRLADECSVSTRWKRVATTLSEQTLIPIYPRSRRWKRRCARPTATRINIAVTGYGGDEDRLKSREAGFDAHLTKPADPSEIRELLITP